MAQTHNAGLHSSPLRPLELGHRRPGAVRRHGCGLGGGGSISKATTEATQADLLAADGLLLGSPNWSGITSSLKSWLDDQGDLWEAGSLAGKPAAAFASGSGPHSGLEITLLQMIHWMLACGMVVVGLPWSERMLKSGSYYGATAVGGRLLKT